MAIDNTHCVFAGSGYHSFKIIRPNLRIRVENNNEFRYDVTTNITNDPECQGVQGVLKRFINRQKNFTDESPDDI